MRLADEMTLRVGLKTIALRPSLRAATRLEQAHGGFDKLLSAIDDGSLTVISEVVKVSGNADDGLFSAMAEIPLIEVMPNLIEGVGKHVLCLAGFDASAPKQAGAEREQGTRITFAEYHAKLFRIATGWLGWSPAQAWDATAGEVLEAYNGHLDMLRAIHGGVEPVSSSPGDAAFDRQALHSLKSFGKAR